MLYDDVNSNDQAEEIELERGPKYIIPMTWFMAYNIYKQGGPSPGKIYYAEILNKNLELDQKMEETIDFKLVSSLKWAYFRDTFGSAGELLFSPSNPVQSQFIHFENNEITKRYSTENLMLPEGIKRKRAKNVAPSISQCPSQDHYPQISSKVTFSSFQNSSAFNSVLQIFMRIPEVVELFINFDKMRNFSCHEMITKFSLVFIAASHIHSGIINTESLYNDLKIFDSNPIFILQNIINRLQVETLKTFPVFTTCQGSFIMNVSCTTCTNLQDYPKQFNYLYLKQRKTMRKIFQSFLGLRVEKHYCNKCGVDQDSYIKKTIKSFPEFLIVCLKSDGKKAKKKTEVEFNLDIGLAYKLSQVVSRENGEYVSFVEGKKSWTRYWDEKCEKALKSNVEWNRLYILIYKKKS